MKKRILALTLIVALALALCPAVLAAEGDFVIDENGVLTKYKGHGGNVVIPDGVTSIGKEAFASCKSLTSVIIPDSVASIDEYAFSWCRSLTSVTIGNGVTSIGECAFGYCRGLTGVTIPYGVTSIGECAFGYCRGLTSVTISDSVTSIGHMAFTDCTSLTDVYYGGTKAQWNAMERGSYNDPLLAATIHCLGDGADADLCTEEDFTIENGVLTEYHGPGGDVVIPDGVTSIGGLRSSNARA